MVDTEREESKRKREGERARCNTIPIKGRLQRRGRSGGRAVWVDKRRSRGGHVTTPQGRDTAAVLVGEPRWRETRGRPRYKGIDMVRVPGLRG